MYTFTLFGLFEQKVRVAQWLKVRTFNHSFLARRGFNTHQRRYYFFYSFQILFQTFSPICMRFHLHIITSVRVRSKAETFLRCYYMHLLHLFYRGFCMPPCIYYPCFGWKKWTLFYVYVIPPQYSHYSICSNNRIKLLPFSYHYV